MSKTIQCLLCRRQSMHVADITNHGGVIMAIVGHCSFCQARRWFDIATVLLTTFCEGE